MERPLQFIINKIEETKAAIFYPLTAGPLKIPNYVINTYRVDCGGNIWFFIDRPPQLMSQFEKEFPVELKYYKKGNDYFIKVFGKAKILNDAHEIEQSIPLSPEQLSKALTWQALVQVEIIDAEYNDYSQKDMLMPLSRIKSYFSSLVDRTKHLLLQPAHVHGSSHGNFFSGIFKK